MTFDPLQQSNIEALDNAEKLKFTQPTTQRQPTAPSRTGANKGVKSPKLPTIKPNRGKRKPGGRHGTSPAQRSASRHNIQSALLARKARRLR